MTKICNVSDCVAMSKFICCKNQGLQFQILLDSKKRENEKIVVSGDLAEFVSIYRVYDKKGNYDFPNLEKTDDYYIKTENELYPELCRETAVLSTEEEERCVLLLDISEREKKEGLHCLLIEVGAEKEEVTIEVLQETLTETDLILTHWFHVDALCNYYKVEPFTESFYQCFSWFLDSYVRQGNNMILKFGIINSKFKFHVFI